MIVIYFILGSLLLFTGYFSYIPDQTRNLIGVVILVYGCWRAVRLYISSKKERE